MDGINLTNECGLALSLILSTKMCHHSGQNVVDSRGTGDFFFYHNINVKENVFESLKKRHCLMAAAFGRLLAATAN